MLRIGRALFFSMALGLFRKFLRNELSLLLIGVLIMVRFGNVCFRVCPIIIKDA